MADAEPCPECGCPYDWRVAIGVASAERARFDVIQGAVARLMTETAIDSWQALECDLAELLGVEPGDEPFTWQWQKHVADGLWSDDTPVPELIDGSNPPSASAGGSVEGEEPAASGSGEKDIPGGSKSTTGLSLDCEHADGEAVRFCHGEPVPTHMDLTREIVALLRALDEFEKPLGEAWWEIPEYQALMDRKAELIARIEATSQ